MNIGMLWYDDFNDKKEARTPARTLAEMVTLGAKFYNQKYSQKANVVYINPRHMPEGGQPPVEVDGVAVEVKPNRTVIKNHFWFGQADDPSFARPGPQ